MSFLTTIFIGINFGKPCSFSEISYDNFRSKLAKLSQQNLNLNHSQKKYASEEIDVSFYRIKLSTWVKMMIATSASGYTVA